MTPRAANRRRHNSMKMTRFLTLLAMALMTALPGCKTDDDETLSEAERQAAVNALKGDMVLSAKATVNGVDKTLLPSGAPALFSFEERDGGLTMWQRDFRVGNMPFPINFGVELKLSPLLSFEKGDFSESGWVRFHGKRGNLSIDGNAPSSAVDETASGDGSTVTGYVNARTKEIVLQISYALMTVEVVAERQAIDPSRVTNYEAEKEQYVRDLEEYKKNHGLDAGD